MPRLLGAIQWLQIFICYKWNKNVRLYGMMHNRVTGNHLFQSKRKRKESLWSHVNVSWRNAVCFCDIFITSSPMLITFKFKPKFAKNWWYTFSDLKSLTLCNLKVYVKKCTSLVSKRLVQLVVFFVLQDLREIWKPFTSHRDLDFWSSHVVGI